MANPRTLARVAARIQQRVAYCLQFELNDPRASFVTVTRVELSTDLRHAKVFWSSLEEGGARNRTQAMLEHAGGFVRKQVGRVLETRTIPQLRWVFDESVERAADMERLIRDARRRDAEIRGETLDDVAEPQDEAPPTASEDSDAAPDRAAR